MTSGYRAIKRAASAAAIYEAEVRGTNDGVRLGRLATQREARIAAFGAIRRAAEVAREQDAIAGVAQSSEAQGFHRYAALQARRVIRAAIGSEKA